MSGRGIDCVLVAETAPEAASQPACHQTGERIPEDSSSRPDDLRATSMVFGEGASDCIGTTLDCAIRAHVGLEFASWGPFFSEITHSVPSLHFAVANGKHFYTLRAEVFSLSEDFAVRYAVHQ